MRTWVYIVIIVVLLGIASFCGIKIYGWHRDNQKIGAVVDEINEISNVEQIDEEGELVNPPENLESDYWKYVKLPFESVDFTELLKTNADTVAFIHVSGTNVNYPIVQASDNDYYLTHAFDKTKNEAGWVFMDYRNQNFQDANTIIYGHGRLDSTVFGSLKNTLSTKWQNNSDNYVIYVSTPTRNYLYQIFSIYTVEAEEYYIRPNFANDDVYQTWIDTMKRRNIAPVDVEVSTADRILTLSTCKNNSGERIVVQAKLLKQQLRDA